MGQVAHALLTRPPLSRNAFLPEGVPARRFVRLACVKHAASVHPEPGSNSHVKSLMLSKTRLANILRLSTFYCFKELSISSCKLTSSCPSNLLIGLNNSLLNLSRLFHCSVIKVRRCCSYQTQLVYNNICFSICQQLFSFFLFLHRNSLSHARWSFIIA